MGKILIENQLYDSATWKRNNGAPAIPTAPPAGLERHCVFDKLPDASRAGLARLMFGNMKVEKPQNVAFTMRRTYLTIKNFHNMGLSETLSTSLLMCPWQFLSITE